MECWAFLLLGVVVLIGVGGVAGIVAVVRSRDDRRRLAALGEEVSSLGTAMAALRREIQRLGETAAGAGAPAEATPPAPGAAEAPAAPAPPETIAARADAAAWTARAGEAARPGPAHGAEAGSPAQPAEDREAAGKAPPREAPAAPTDTLAASPTPPGPLSPATAGQTASAPIAAGEPTVPSGTPASGPAGTPGPPPPPAAAPAAGPPTPPPPPPARIDWERWIGVRGAAVLGGVVLALAGLLFLRYSIEQGWFPPRVRVAIGIAVGLVAIVGSERLRRGYATTANALTGAGVVLLYASFWAARTLYGLIGDAAAFALMALVTVAAGVLAWRHRSRTVAVLGLVGGFATPFLLASGEDRPITLFGYLLLLDLGLLVLARRRGWPGLAMLGLAGTTLWQVLWIGTAMDPARLALGLAILGIFAVVFIAAGTAGAVRDPVVGTEPGGDAGWAGSRIAGLLLPFAFAVYLAARADLGAHFWPVAVLLALLSAAALWLGATRGEPLLATGAAAATLGAYTVWLLRTAMGAAVGTVPQLVDSPDGVRVAAWPSAAALAWEAVAIAAGLAAVFHLGLELAAVRRRRAVPPPTAGTTGSAFAATTAGLGRPATIAAAGFLLLLALRPLADADALFAPWLTGWLVLAALLTRQAFVTGRGGRLVLAATGSTLGWSLYFLAHRDELAAPPPAVLIGIAAALAVAFQLAGLARGAAAFRRPATAAAALVPVAALLTLMCAAHDPALAPGLLLPATLVLALLAVLVATRAGSGAGLLGVMALTAWIHLFWVSPGTSNAPSALPETALFAFGVFALAVVLFTAWPFAAGRRFAASRPAWVASALAGPAWFLPLLLVFESRWGEGAIGLLPLGLAAVALAAAYRARGLWPAGEPRRTSALAWFGAVALGLVAVAVPLQLDNEWVTIGWALQAAGTVALWRRLDHPGLKWFALALAAAVTARLVANPLLLGYHPASGLPILNWLTYTYLVPAAALLAAARMLAPLEAGRARPAEASLYAAGRPVGAAACVFATIAVVFVWINLTVFDLYSTGPELTVSFERLPARDLTLSLSWAAYALLLLAIGMRRGSVALRWISLGFLVLTIGKVFLYDLGELTDLYRVASLVGLALSLLAVSVAYQRFVFRSAPKAGDEVPP